MTPEPSRYARILEPDQFAMMFANHERYTAQSAATRDGQRAECPEREALSRELGRVA